MSKRIFKLILIGIALSTTVGICQPSSRTFMTGRIEPVDPGANLYVELHDLGNGTIVERETVSVDGTFQFRELSSGSYQVRVITALHHETLLEEFVDVNPFGAQIVLRLPKVEPRARPISGVVSVRELQSRIPKKALEAFTKAQHYSESSKIGGAIEQLHKAIALDPGWRDAHVNLGAALMRAGRYQEALTELEEAIRLGPPSAIVYTNYGAALGTINRLAEGEKAVREAIRIDPSFWRAHYLLGHMLALQSGREREAVEQLRTAAPAVPGGRIIAARVLLREGNGQDAAAELRAYLESGERTHRAEARELLAGLKSSYSVAK